METAHKKVKARMRGLTWIGLLAGAALLTGCGTPSDEEVAEAIAEAEAEFPLIVEALVAEADDGDLPYLSELNLPADLQDSSHESFSYWIRTLPAVDGGPKCVVSLELSAPHPDDPIMLNKTHLRLEESVCESADLD